MLLLQSRVSFLRDWLDVWLNDFSFLKKCNNKTLYQPVLPLSWKLL